MRCAAAQNGGCHSSWPARLFPAAAMLDSQPSDTSASGSFSQFMSRRSGGGAAEGMNDVMCQLAGPATTSGNAAANSASAVAGPGIW